MRSLDEFFPQVRLDVPGVALPIVRQAILDACRDFCKRTKVWNTIKIFSLSPNKSEYQIAIPENTFIQDITYLGRLISGSSPVKYDDRTRRKVTESDLDYESPNWRESESSNAEFWRWGIKSDRRTVFFYPIPTVALADGIKCKVILAPNQDASEVPHILFDEYAEGIGAGASAKLLEIPGKEWTDLQAADMRQRQFNRAVSSAFRKDRSESNTVKYRRLGGGW